MLTSGGFTPREPDVLCGRERRRARRKHKAVIYDSQLYVSVASEVPETDTCAVAGVPEGDLTTKCQVSLASIQEHRLQKNVPWARNRTDRRFTHRDDVPGE